MLYEFKSRATGTVVMTGPVAEQVLAIVGKAPGPQGIFTVEQMGPAIAALQAAVERERTERTERESDPRDADRHRDDEEGSVPKWYFALALLVGLGTGKRR